MPSLSTYRHILGNKSIGQAHKSESDMIMEATWDNDIATRTAYFYDYEHDSDPFKLVDMRPENDENKIPISVKYLQYSSQTYSKDQTTFHLQYKPSEDFSSLKFYEKYAKRFGAECPVGLYCDIPDNKGIYRRWIVVGLADYYDAQFSTYEILPSDYTFCWVDNGRLYQMAGITRTQNSYTSGVWVGNKYATPDDTAKFILPLNNTSIKLFYNKRIVVDTNVDVANGELPRVFEITKVDRLDQKGLCMYTIKQDQWNAKTDFANYTVAGDPSSIRGMYANYYSDVPIEPDEPTTDIVVKVSAVGTQNIKVGGSYKTLYVEFYDNNELADFRDGTWTFGLQDNPYDSSLLDIQTKDDNPKLEDNQVRVKFLGNGSYVGDSLIATYTSTDGLVGELRLPISRL